MILAACGGRGNGEKYAEGLARAESGEGSGKWEVGRKEGGWGGVDGNGEEEMGKGVIGTGRGWQWGGGCEEDMERGQWGSWGGRWEGGKRIDVRRRWRGGQWGSSGGGGGGGRGKMGRGQWRGERGRDGEGGKKGPEEGRFHRWI